MKKTILILILAGFGMSVGCLKKDDDKGSTGTGVPNFTVTATCTEAVDPANCTVAANGEKIFFAVGATCTDIMSNTTGPMLTTSTNSTMACSGSPNSCTGSSTGLTWQADGASAPAFGGITFAAAAWFDTATDNPPDDPGAGDVICCQDGFTISEGATLNINTGCSDL